VSDTLTMTLDDLVATLREGKAPKRNEREDMRMNNVQTVQNDGGIVRVDNARETFQKGDKKGSVMPPETVAARYATLIRENEIDGVHVVASPTMALLADNENYVKAIALL
jgi:hypothetical protein